MSLLPLNQVFEFDISVHDISTGALVNADSTPVYNVYEQGTRTPILSNQAMTNDGTGIYYGSVTCSAANGFDVGKTYQIKATAIVSAITDTAVVSRFRIIAAEAVTGSIGADVKTWLGTVPNALQSGRMDSYMGAVAAGVIAAASFAANALDAVWSTATRTLTAFSFSTTVGTNNDKTGYALTAGERTSIADALLDRDMSVGTDSGSSTARTVRQALRILRNKWSIAGGTLTVYKENDNTSSWNAIVTTSVADPVNTVDPA